MEQADPGFVGDPVHIPERKECLVESQGSKELMGNRNSIANFEDMTRSSLALIHTIPWNLQILGAVRIDKPFYNGFQVTDKAPL